MDMHTLYEEDETDWLDTTARLIAAGRYGEIDWEDLREFLTSMAERDRREVKSRLARLIEHLLKWEHQPGKRANSWKRTIAVQQAELSDALEASSLRRHAVEVLPEAYRRGSRWAATATGLPPETFPESCPWGLDELLSYKAEETSRKA